MKEKNTKSFEEELIKLENIVTALEKGDLSLDDSVKKFEEGINISKECNKMLETAEKKISILIGKDGDLEEENFASE